MSTKKSDLCECHLFAVGSRLLLHTLARTPYHNNNLILWNFWFCRRWLKHTAHTFACYFARSFGLYRSLRRPVVCGVFFVFEFFFHHICCLTWRMLLCGLYCYHLLAKSFRKSTGIYESSIFYIFMCAFRSVSSRLVHFLAVVRFWGFSAANVMIDDGWLFSRIAICSFGSCSTLDALRSYTYEIVITITIIISME